MARPRATPIGAPPQNASISYGERLGPAALADTLGRLLDGNTRRIERGGHPIPICVWGAHGIGKTAIVREVAEQRGAKLAYVAPAQFEEMGDLHGLPVLVDGEHGPRTRFAAPDWVPREPGPGVLLLDDINRADDRILRGLMQLLQTSAMFSWALPPGWQIVSTANPEGGDYSVTAMDDAMLTRMLHVTLELDVRDWAAWARRQGLDARGVDFVLAYPEVITGRRTTPRSLVQFFETLVDVPDLAADIGLVRTLASSTLDDVTVASFLAHVRGTSGETLGPLDILDADDGAALAARIDRLLVREDDPSAIRLDQLGLLSTRLSTHLTDPQYEAEARHGDNLEVFLLHPRMPADLRLAFHREIMNGKNEGAKALLRRKSISAVLLDAL